MSFHWDLPQMLRNEGPQRRAGEVSLSAARPTRGLETEMPTEGGLW